MCHDLALSTTHLCHMNSPYDVTCATVSSPCDVTCATVSSPCDVTCATVLSALNKTWCVSCFCCSACHAKLSAKTRFVEVDHRPVCKRCFSRLPQELRRRLAARGRETRAQRGARP
ncbi:LIM domain-containing protein unc-97-like [Lethenteron reissneri]|uniref:LIM domain-containing protein unc-97-like n=1 Tax=Lethenteron reissneri TaxID=7753 RepID=UPI002AB77906|nr:LIM domain-containing protein unc-97-like [Lethenteron reissneri]